MKKGGLTGLTPLFVLNISFGKRGQTRQTPFLPAITRILVAAVRRGRIVEMLKVTLGQ
jgi:hypothetical protein